MKTATTADLRNHFRRISGWLAPYVTRNRYEKQEIDFAAQRGLVWRGRRFSRAEVTAMRAAELEGEE